jgi:hypothetical protein
MSSGHDVSEYELSASGLVRAQCLTILLLKHFALCGTITGSSYCSSECKML